MKYGLIPRVTEELWYWDEPKRPQADIVSVKSVSTYAFPAHSGAYVAIDREFLQDYATIRDRALIQMYYLQETVPLSDDIQGSVRATRRCRGKSRREIISVSTCWQ